ncbi:DUF2202 domain-containing protein [Candidatus Terasakiella magnetica]|nr:DUF2202 domain-containing protein [Candidatus Terasakiella magnetica]
MPAETAAPTQPGGALIKPIMGLSQHEVNDLRYKREEEKLAHDLYHHFATKWQVPLFKTVVEAEVRHIEAINTLLHSYNIPDPTKGTAVGEFNSPKLNLMYKDLVAKGEQSLEDAYLAAGMIEEIDISDLDRSLTRSAQSNIILTYKNLQLGSRNHLRRFSKALQELGTSYSAQHMPFNKVDFIITSPLERAAPERKMHTKEPSAKKPDLIDMIFEMY